MVLYRTHLGVKNFFLISTTESISKYVPEYSLMFEQKLIHLPLTSFIDRKSKKSAGFFSCIFVHFTYDLFVHIQSLIPFLLGKYIDCFYQVLEISETENT